MKKPIGIDNAAKVLNETDNLAVLMPFEGTLHYPGLFRLHLPLEGENIHPPMWLMGKADDGQIYVCPADKPEPFDMTMMATDYWEFANHQRALDHYLEHPKAERPAVTAVLNAPFVLHREKVTGSNRGRAMNCGAKGHIFSFKLVHPKLSPRNTVEKVHKVNICGQVTPNHDGIVVGPNIFLLSNGEIVWVNWLAMMKQSMPLYMGDDLGRAEMKLTKLSNMKHIGQNGEHQNGFCHVTPAEFMGIYYGAFRLDCKQFRNLEEMIAYRDKMMNQ